MTSRYRRYHNNGIARHDGADLHFFIHHRTPSLVHVASWVTDLGGVGFLALLATVVAAVLWRRGAGLVVALAPGLALGAAGLCVAIGKQVVGRARPAAALRLATKTEPSFPSGHAADSTAFYVTLALVIAVVVLRRPAARIAVLAVAVLLSATIGTSRLVLGVHWPTDVLAGWALGITVALTVTMAALALTPLDAIAALPGGASAPSSTGCPLHPVLDAIATLAGGLLRRVRLVPPAGS